MQQELSDNPSQTNDQVSARIDNTNHVPNDNNCKQVEDENHSETNLHPGWMQWVYIVIYALTFALLVIATLLTQNYVLLPIIRAMVDGLVGVLYYIIGSRFIRHHSKDSHQPKSRRK